MVGIKKKYSLAENIRRIKIILPPRKEKEVKKEIKKEVKKAHEEYEEENNSNLKAPSFIPSFSLSSPSRQNSPVLVKSEARIEQAETLQPENPNPPLNSLSLNRETRIYSTRTSNYSSSQTSEIESRPGYESGRRTAPVIDQELSSRRPGVVSPVLGDRTTGRQTQTIEGESMRAFSEQQEKYRVELQEATKLPFHQKSRRLKTGNISQ